MSTKDHLTRRTAVALIFGIPVLLLIQFGYIAEDTFLGSLYYFLIGFLVFALIGFVYAKFYMEDGIGVE